MKDRIVELLVQIMSEMQTKSRLTDADLGELRIEGYSQSEISEALSWLYDHMEVVDGVVTIPPGIARGARRVFHEVEKSTFTIDSQGYLMQLRELGLLDDHDLELVIERGVQTGYERLSVDEVREIVASVLFGKKDGANRSWLNNKESIN